MKLMKKSKKSLKVIIMTSFFYSFSLTQLGCGLVSNPSTYQGQAQFSQGVMSSELKSSDEQMDSEKVAISSDNNQRYYDALSKALQKEVAERKTEDARLDGLIQELAAKLKELWAHLKDEIARLEAADIALKSEMEKIKEDVLAKLAADLEATISALKEELATTSQSLEGSLKLHTQAQLDQQLVEINRMREAAIAALAAEQAQNLANIYSEIEKKGKEFKQLEDLVKGDFAKSLSSMQQQFAMTKLELDSYKAEYDEKLGNVQAQLEAQSALAQAATAQVAALQKAVVASESRLKDLIGVEKYKLQSQIDEIVGKIGGKGGILEAITFIKQQSTLQDGKINSLFAQVDSLTSDFEATSQELAIAIAEAKKQNQDSIAKLEGQVESYSSIYQQDKLKLENRLNLLEGNFSRHVEAFEAFKKEVASKYASKEELQSLKMLANDLNTSMSLLQGIVNDTVLVELAKGKKELESLRLQLFAAPQGEIYQLQKEVEAQKEALKASKQISEAEVIAAEEKIKAYRLALDKIYLKFANFSSSFRVGQDMMDLMKISIEYQATAIFYKTSIAEQLERFKLGVVGASLTARIAEVERAFLAAIDYERSQKQKIQETSDLVSQQLTDWTERVAETEKALAAYHERNTQLEKAVENLNKQMASLPQEIMLQVRELMAGLEQKVAVLEGQMASAAGDIARVAGLQDEAASQYEAQAKELADLKVRSHALQTELMELEERVDRQQVSQDLKAQLDSTRLQAKTALSVFVRAYADLQWRTLHIWQPNQLQPDFYDHTFKEMVWKGESPSRAKDCQIEAGASFANAMGLDAQMLLSMVLVEDVVSGQAGVDLAGENMLDGVETLQRLAVVNVLNRRYPAVDDESCLADVKKWARASLLSSEKINAYTSKYTLKEALLADVDPAQGFLKLRERLRHAIDAYKASWLAYQQTIIAVDASHESKLAMYADALLDSVVTEQELRDVKENFDGNIESIKQLVGNVEVNVDGIQQQVDELTELKLQLQEKLGGLLAAEGNLESYVKKSIEDRIRNLQLPEVDAIHSSLLTTIAVVAKLADRMGYPDLRSEAEGAGLGLNKKFKVNYQVKPFIAQVQHMYTGLYEDIKNHAKTWNDSWSNWNESKLASVDATCSDAHLGFGYGSDSKWDKCWVNFRSAPLGGSNLKKSLEQVVYRVIGSADILKLNAAGGYVKYFNLNKASNDGERAARQIIAREVFADPEAVSLRYDEVNKYLAAPAKVRVNGNNFMGAFDLHDPDSLKTGIKGANFYNNFSVTFTPYRASLDNRITLANGSLNPSFGSSSQVQGPAKSYQVFLYSPLVLDFLNQGILKTTHHGEQVVRFDLNADGVAENTGWVDGVDGGFLALDVNGNGKIDDGKELFGQASLLANGDKAPHGYEALKRYDGNQDGLIDRKDAIFTQLKVWFDYNLDGLSQKEELFSLSQKEVTAIALNFQELGEEVKYQNGNLLKYQAKFYGPTHCRQSGCASYDVFFGASVSLSVK